MNIFELFIVQPIFNFLLWLYTTIGDFGVAIIIFTIVIRFAMWPLVVRQLHQVKAMRKLQPELAEIRKKAKGNKQLEGMQMLELYKKHGVKPFRSILMLLIQLPIFIALFQVIQIFTSHREKIELFTYGFMRNIESVKELIANPETFHEYFLNIIDLSTHAITDNGVNIFLLLLAVLAAVTQFVISKQTNPQPSTKRLRDVLAEAGAGKEPDQAELNAVMMGKMVKILPVIMFFIMMGLPGAIGLYYVTSNTFAIIQQHFILKRDQEEMQEIAEAMIKREGKKATAKARARQARKAETVPNITRIQAKDTQKKESKS